MSKCLNLLFVGDIMFDRRVETYINSNTKSVRESIKNAEQIFDFLKKMGIKRDIQFGNLESVLSNQCDSFQCTAKYCFCTPPTRSLPIIKKLGFNVLSVSNNHMDNYGKVPWEESRKHLRKAKILTVGDYSNSFKPVIKVCKGIKIAFFALCDTNDQDSDKLKIIKDWKQKHEDVKLFICSYHWGFEYENIPHPSVIKKAHLLIDAGVNIIVGHHPHVIQPIEKYKKGLIMYSLGNFIFDQVGKRQNESLIVNVKVTFNTKKEPIIDYLILPLRIVNFFPRLPSISEYRRSQKKLQQCLVKITYQ